MSQTMRLYRDDGEGNLIPWDFTLEGNVIVKEEIVAGSYATPQEEAALPQATQLQLADWRARGIRYTIKDGRPHVVSVPPLELLMQRFFNEEEPCFFHGCEALRKQWVEFRDEALQAEPGCDVKCTNGKVKRQFMERLRPILSQTHEHATTLKKAPASS